MIVRQIEERLRAKSHPEFISAIKACLKMGPDGQHLLLATYHAATDDERKSIVIAALSEFPTREVSQFLQGVAADRGAGSGYRCAALWALGRMRRQDDGVFLVSILTDSSSVVRHQALLATAYHGVTVDPELALALMRRVAKSKYLGKDVGPLSPTISIVTIFASAGAADQGTVNRFVELIDRVWSRLAEFERDWLTSYWRKTAANALMPAKETSDCHERMMVWWEENGFFATPPSLR